MKVGDLTYQVHPQSYRQPAADGKTGGYHSSYKFLWNEYTMWGHGFANVDHGSALKNAVEGCALLPQTWDFQYGFGDNGREWTAKFRTGVFQKKCVGHAGASAGAPGGFGCSGSG